MGLDNQFVLKNFKNKELKIVLSKFRNYYELRDYALRYGEKLETGSEYDRAFSVKLLLQLKTEVQDIVDILYSIKPNTLLKYDDEGYPEELDDLFYGSNFSPSRSRSRFGGTKLLKLYSSVENMLGILENNEGFYIVLETSF